MDEDNLFLDESEGGVEGIVQGVILLGFVELPCDLLIEFYEASLVLDQFASRWDIVDDTDITS